MSPLEILHLNNLANNLSSSDDEDSTADSTTSTTVSNEEAFNTAVDNGVSFVGITTMLLGLIVMLFSAFTCIKALTTHNSREAHIPGLILGPLIFAFGGWLKNSSNSDSDNAAESTDSTVSTAPSTPETTTPETTAPETTPPETPAPEPRDVNLHVDSTVIWFSLALVALVLCIIAVIVLSRRIKHNREEKEKKRKRYDYKLSKLNASRNKLRTISAQYAQAYTDPEVVLYKPLIISNHPDAEKFVNSMMDTRELMDNTYADFTHYDAADLPAGINANADEVIDAVAALQRQWTALNEKATRIGTPILDTDKLRRAERLWAVATNESATVAERRRAINKLDDIIAESKNLLAGDDTAPAALEDACNAIAEVISQGHAQALIAAPESVQKITTQARPMLTA